MLRGVRGSVGERCVAIEAVVRSGVPTVLHFHCSDFSLEDAAHVAVLGDGGFIRKRLPEPIEFSVKG